MNFNAIFRWANDNQGILALIAIFVSLPALFIWAYQVVRSIWPSGVAKQNKVIDEFAHAEKLKKDVESHVEWDLVHGFYGEFMLRDTERKLPNTEEVHSSVETPYSIAALTKIHTEHLEFTSGSLWSKHIKKIADHWYFAAENEDDSIRVETVYWVNYRDIAYIRWETDDYWEWPQFCCRFTSSNKFPLSRIFFAEKKESLPRPFYHEVVLHKDVAHRPHGLLNLQ